MVFLSATEFGGEEKTLAFSERPKDGDLLPDGGILLSGSISGGDLRRWFLDAVQQHPEGCWLLAERLSMVFPLPCPTGQGAPVSVIPDGRSFYSESLGCRYLHEPDRFYLFDTDETIQQKIRLAEACGFRGWVKPQP